MRTLAANLALVIPFFALSLPIQSLDAASVIFDTDAQATIYEGSFNGAAPYGPASDGILHFDFARTPSPVLNAFFPGGGDTASWELRGVAEFDISSLIGQPLTSATVGSLSGFSGLSGWDGNRLSGYYGEGQVELADFNNIGNQLAVLPGDAPTGFSVDITSFIQAAAAQDQKYVGFVLWQASTTSGFTLQSGLQLSITSPADIQATAPLASPDPSFGSGNPSGGAVPLPAVAWSGLVLLGSVGLMRGVMLALRHPASF